jgi:hypothetical protein
MKNKSHWKVVAIFGIISCLCLAGIAVTASANPATNRKIAYELVEITSKGIFDETLVLIENIIQQEFAKAFADLPPEKRAAANTVQRETTEWFREFFAWEQIRELYADIYIEVFTEEEMRELIKFYRSPLGQKLLAKAPELMEKSLEKTQMLLYREMPKLQERLERKIKELEQY